MIDKKAISTVFVTPFKGIDMAMLLAKALESNDQEILDINRQQLDQGKDSKGASLGRYANFKYKNRWEPVDLKLTGDFREKFTLAPGKKSAEIFSQDRKNDILEKKYGKDIFGIAKPMLPNVGEIIKPTLKELFKEEVTK